MKRFILIIILHIVLLSTAGVTLNALYSNGSYVRQEAAVKTCYSNVMNGVRCNAKSIVIKLKVYTKRQVVLVKPISKY